MITRVSASLATSAARAQVDHLHKCGRNTCLQHLHKCHKSTSATGVQLQASEEYCDNACYSKYYSHVSRLSRRGLSTQTIQNIIPFYYILAILQRFDFSNLADFFNTICYVSRHGRSRRQAASTKSKDVKSEISRTVIIKPPAYYWFLKA